MVNKRKRVDGRVWVTGTCLTLAALVISLGACRDKDKGNEATGTLLSPEAELGRQIFHDVSLSASGKQACATCHDPRFAHGAPNALPAQMGGPALDQQGRRLTPSIRYLAATPPFRFDTDGVPKGGLYWDGRADTLTAQARSALLDPMEMGNASAADVAAKLAKAPYAPDFERHFGPDALAQPERTLDHLAQALASYQREDPGFQPYTSKYDAVLHGTATLTAQEERGLQLFKDPAKGNCAACHPADLRPDGRLPLFTDFGYATLGLPRNPELKANADPDYADLGLCARDRGDLWDRPDLCGAFRVPSLRNVALREALFHNGRFKSLKDALMFYAQRDTRPEQWYPRAADGAVNQFDDLPEPLRGNVISQQAPYNRQPGDEPALTSAEIDDVIAFLKTLTDGYKP